MTTQNDMIEVEQEIKSRLNLPGIDFQCVNLDTRYTERDNKFAIMEFEAIINNYGPEKILMAMQLFDDDPMIEHHPAYDYHREFVINALAKKFADQLARRLLSPTFERHLINFDCSKYSNDWIMGIKLVHYIVRAITNNRHNQFVSDNYLPGLQTKVTIEPTNDAIEIQIGNKTMMFMPIADLHVINVRMNLGIRIYHIIRNLIVDKMLR